MRTYDKNAILLRCLSSNELDMIKTPFIVLYHHMTTYDKNAILNLNIKLNMIKTKIQGVVLSSYDNI